MIQGETSREYVLELLRWLGPEAELIEQCARRAAVHEELVRRLACYADA